MDFKLPPIARDEVLPNSFDKAKQEEELRKRQLRHDWKIAIFSVVGGTVGGIISSLVFSLITSS